MLAYRPVTQEGSRIPPSDFDSHRVNHIFRAPCCLCAADSPGIVYTECALYMPLMGEYAGEYVAGCPYERCGFIGEKPLLSLDCTVPTIDDVGSFFGPHVCQTRPSLRTLPSSK
jgi:hypothetical protein